MNNYSIEQFFQQFQDEFNIKPNGQVKSSIRGVARLCDVSAEALAKALRSSVNPTPSKLSLFLSECGFEPTTQYQWLETGIPDTAISLILEYYAYECEQRYRKQQAKQFSRAFRAIGIRAWIQQQKGWQEDEVDGTDNAYTARIKYSAERINIPADYWTVFDECSFLMGQLEKYFPIDRLDLIDGSVGKRWSKHRQAAQQEGAEWIRQPIQYQHPFPDHRKNPWAWAYHIDELKHFRYWFDHKYKPDELWEYLQGKYDPQLIEQARPRLLQAA